MTTKSKRNVSARPKYLNSDNFKFNQERMGESNDQPSETVPDQSMPIKEIISRYAKGLPISGTSSKPYYEDPENPSQGINLKTLDLADLEEIARESGEKLRDFKKLKKDVDTAKSKRAQKRQLDLEDEIAKLKAEKAAEQH